MCDMLNCGVFLDVMSMTDSSLNSIECIHVASYRGCLAASKLGKQIPALSMTPKALGVGRNLTTPAEVTSVVLTSTTTSSSVYGLHILSIPILVESG